MSGALGPRLQLVNQPSCVCIGVGSSVVSRIRDLGHNKFRSNQAKIKNQLNETQSKLEILTTRVNEVEERANDIEDRLMVRKEAEEKREKQLRGHGRGLGK